MGGGNIKVTVLEKVSLLCSIIWKKQVGKGGGRERMETMDIFFKYIILKYLFIWLYRRLSCGMQGLQLRHEGSSSLARN